MTTALATVSDKHLQHHSHTGDLTVQDLVDRKRKILEVMRAVMVEGEHYGKIPGCGDKPTLLKPGAEVLATTFGLAPRFIVKRTDMPGGHREYEITCQLVSIGTDKVIGEGLGSCSTMESKYRWRGGSRTCPECGKATIIKGKAEYGGGWLCFQKKGGCGAKWKDGAAEIEGQSLERVENPDIADTYNTVLKMAKKRAQVDCTLTAVGASDLLTQDLEDLPPASRNFDRKNRDADDAEFEDVSDERTLNRTADGEAPSRDVHPNAPAQQTTDDLEAKAIEIIADIEAAKSFADVKNIAPRFAALPKGTRERAMAHDAYKKRLAFFEQQAGASA